MILVVTAAVVLLGAQLLLHSSGTAVWDDSYICYRYAHHLTNGQGYTWNAGEPSTFGVTSALYGWFCAIPVLFLDHLPALAVYVSSMLWGLLFLLLLYKSVRAFFPEAGKEAMGIAALVACMNAFSWAEHFSSGMDLTLALAWLTFYLVAVYPGKGWLPGILGGFAFLVRPELAAFSLGIPALGWILFPEKRSFWFRTGLVSAALTALSLLLCHAAMGSALPLSFFAKTGAYHDAGIREVYATASYAQWAWFVLLNFPVFGFILYACLKRLRGLRFAEWKYIVLLCVPAAVLSAYYLFFVTHIMGYHARFYFYTWPAWFVAAVLSARVFSREEKVRHLLVKGLVVLLTVFAVTAGFGKTWWEGKPASAWVRFGRFDMAFVYEYWGRFAWPVGDRFTQLPDDVVIATTELGIISAMNPGKKFVDIVGLTDPLSLDDVIDPSRVLCDLQPGIVYMPHPHYTDLTRAFESDSCLAKYYTYYRAKEVASWQGVALLNSSPHFETMKKMVEDHQKQYEGWDDGLE